jgi:hypothetical protein
LRRRLGWQAGGEAMYLVRAVAAKRDATEVTDPWLIATTC